MPRLSRPGLLHVALLAAATFAVPAAAETAAPAHETAGDPAAPAEAAPHAAPAHEAAGAPAEAAPHEAPAPEAAGHAAADAAASDVSAHDAPAHDAPTHDVPAHGVPAQEAPAGEAPAEVAGPAGEAPAQAGLAAPGFSMDGDLDSLAPYKLMRSLQFVQDAVVRGDHSAMEMQRFLIGVIDSRLRSADQKVFDDPRNVDAALVYAMSGGNPETLDILAAKDKFGNFDNEVTTVLRAYLNGRAAKTKTTLSEVVELYRDTEIGPYLTLVAANVMAALNKDDEALEMFDWARLTLPGTLVEEAALRRSLFVAARKNLVDRALLYAELYARRFINSPYAGQYADLLVDLVVPNYGKVGNQRLEQILSFMDRPRKREVYLRIARKAVISGLRDLAVFASAKAEELLDPEDTAPQTLADLYSGMARIPTDGVGGVLARLEALPEAQLSQRDRALRDAARRIAEDVLRKPDPDSLTQAIGSNVGTPEGGDPLGGRPPVEGDNGNTGPEQTLAAGMDAATAAADEAFQGFVATSKDALDRIDKMLEQEKKDAGS
ncbi:chemotaxis protein [Hoeflea olei]|uniref:Chemotaxis protein n=1 Tax=Hoeflea olei TaxID=1480615 RepID=A0A1C1YRT4_9HYPH|nr:chemotaxis protein [Hoeflea olei]OCW56184.1 hypothetical protein AWJ14_18980 [Hoeflea olei]